MVSVSDSGSNLSCQRAEKTLYKLLPTIMSKAINQLIVRTHSPDYDQEVSASTMWA